MKGSGTNKKTLSCSVSGPDTRKFPKNATEKKPTEHREDRSSSDALGEMVIKIRTIWMLTTSLARRTVIHEVSVLSSVQKFNSSFLYDILGYMCDACVCGHPLVLNVT